MQIIVIPFLLLFLQASLALPYAPTDYPDLVSNLPNFTTGSFPTSYAGFAPLDQQNNSALFYWFFPANGQYSNDVPTLLWLNGGPGSSSMFGLFEENGPFRLRANSNGGYSLYSVDQPGKLQSWTAYYNVLFLDSPVGTGFSYTANNSYPTNEDQVAANIWTAIQYFMSVHPETVNAKWYYTGESYAGRYVPAIAYWTLQFNDQISTAQLQGQLINLQGVLVGDGYVVGVSQRITSIDASQAANLLTPNQYSQVKTIAAECQQLSGQGSQYTDQAVNRCNDILGYLSDVSSIDALDVSLSGAVTDGLGNELEPYLNSPDVIQALHVSGSKKQGQLFNVDSDIVGQYLEGDILGNSLNYINYILPKIQCLFYEGNLDAQDGSYGIYDWFKMLDAPYNNIWNSTRNIWYIDQFSAGMYTQYENMVFVVVDSAGHFVPYFELNATIKMIEIFTLRNNNWGYYAGFTPLPNNQIMNQYSNNCNGHGTPNNAGICVCNQGYGLGDCSALAVDIDTTQTYTLNQRGYLFFRVPLNGQDTVVGFQNEQGVLGVYYTPFTPGPVADNEEAEASLFPTDSSPSNRSLYLNAYGNSVGYLTIQNSQYFNNVSFQITLTPQSALASSMMGGQSEVLIWGVKQSDMTLILYGMSIIMALSAVMIVLAFKKRSGSGKVRDVRKVKDEIVQPLVS